MTLALRSIQGEIEVSTGDPETALVIYRAVKPEVEDSPSERSSMSIDLDDDLITISISATDSASFRATLNSSIRWVKLSMEMIDTLKSLDLSD
ncbi:MAG: hypothetical protein GX212_07310 [Methanothermobacter wolfeii]|uniref:KEOPS complex subunit Pcc1 n=1 Tax=Methanothermobacter TaxID=145260 RepID=UPI0009429385|nr:KEOPS complex subunit Pcc1 [Methanothermobacter sp. THM-1]NLM03148.1 hypothetical protein [Methanothermobacter wolfeii]QHN06476.1 hypothetical protein FZP57_05000 [Methanothermobacter sp. THM-1]